MPAFAQQVSAIAHGRQEAVISVGNLDAACDLLDVRDVCDAYVLSLEAGLAGKLVPGTVLNIAFGQSRRVRDVLAELVRLSGVDAKIRTDPERLRPSDIPRALGDASRMRALGWTPRYGWDQTLGDLLADWMARPSPRSEDPAMDELLRVSAARPRR